MTSSETNHEQEKQAATLSRSPSVTAKDAGQAASVKEAEQGGKSNGFNLWEYLNADVDPNETTAPLAAYSFMTGYMYVVSRS